ncbi:hypothetical protein DFS34DRAFT_603098 [Phlyctochytrium arcticum]|nr:hypothetical protein DFS34DRAFT_603098 [Phlyctochytrium arcticum]
MANPKLDNKLLLDMEILGRCYEESLDQLVPLGDSLAVQWDEVVGGNLEEIQQLRHALDSQERRAQHMTRQCGELQMLNTTLLEENTMLRKEVEIMRKFGAEPCATPMSEDVRSVASIPLALPSPAAMDFDLTDQDLLAMPSALVSAPASPPDLDYGEIIDEQAEDTAGLNRLYSDVHKTEALLVDVEKRRRPSVRLSTLDRVPPPTSANRHSPRMGQHEPNSSRAPPSLHIDTNKSYGGGGGNRSPNVKSRKSMSSFHHHRHSRDLSDNRKSYASSSGSTSSSDLTRHLHVANTNYTSSPTSKSPLLLPFILPSSGSLWKELLPKNPKTDAAIVIQTHFRGYRARKMFKNVKLRLMIVNEMLDTEASYVKGLLTIHKEFMIPLKEEMYHSSSVISRRDYDTIFRYIDEIMAFNQLLLDDLVERIAFWHFEQVLGDIFVRAADSMKIYAHFVNNYDEAVETLSRVSDNPQFDKKLAEIAKVMGHRAPALTDLLITPVQRPPRYLLMLKELLKRTDARHPDFECLALAVGRMERTNQIINDRKKRFEMMKQMQASFVGSPIDFVASGRYLTHSGTLVELSDSASSTAADPRSIRAVFLFTDVVLCAEQIGSASSSPTRQHFTDPTTTNPKFAFRWALPIGDIVAIHHPPDDPLSIRLSWKSASASHLGVKTLYALTKDEHKKWSGMFGYALKSWPKVVRQSAMSGTGLIVAPGDGLHHSTSSPQSQIRTLTQSLQTIEDEIQHETQINTGYKLLEGLHSRTSTLLPTNPSDHVSHSFSVNPSSTHHPHPSKSSGKRWSANMLYQPSGFNTSPIQSHATHSPLLNSSQQPSHHHHQESNRRLGVLRSQALKQQVLRRELESVVS